MIISILCFYSIDSNTVYKMWFYNICFLKIGLEWILMNTSIFIKIHKEYSESSLSNKHNYHSFYLDYSIVYHKQFHRNIPECHAYCHCILLLILDNWWFMWVLFGFHYQSMLWLDHRLDSRMDISISSEYWKPHIDVRIVEKTKDWSELFQSLNVVSVHVLYIQSSYKLSISICLPISQI